MRRRPERNPLSDRPSPAHHASSRGSPWPRPHRRRHGVGRGRTDFSAAAIRLLDRLGGRARRARRRRAESPRITPDGNHALPSVSWQEPQDHRAPAPASLPPRPPPAADPAHRRPAVRRPRALGPCGRASVHHRGRRKATHGGRGGRPRGRL